MGKVDISKLAEKLAELNKPRGGGGSNMSFLTIKDGRNVIRILPPKQNAESFYEEVFVHYGVGKSDSNKNGTMVVCPTTHGEDKPCPVCELTKELYKLSKKKDDSYEKQARSIGRKKRVYYNALDRAEDIDEYKREESEDGKVKWTNPEGKEGSPVRVYGSGIGVFKDILGFIVDPEYGDITDAEEGLDLIITKSGTGFNTNYEVKTVRKESEIGFEHWEECLHDLSNLSKAKSYDEIAALMSGEDTSNSEDDEDEEDTSPSETPTSTSDSEDDDLQDEIKKALEKRKNKK